MRDDIRYNCELRDNAAGLGLGLILDDPGDVLGYRRALSNPYAAKAATGDTGYHDLTDWSMAVFADWTAGRGYEEEGVAGGYFDAQGVEARIDGQLTLGPLPQVAAGTTEHAPGNVREYLVGDPGDLKNHDDSTSRSLLPDDARVGQRFLVPSTGQWWVTLVKVKMAKYESGHTGSVKGTIYSDVDGLPDTELVSVLKAHADIGAEFAEETFTFASPYAVTAGSYYWLVIDQNGSGAYSYRCAWGGSYPDGGYALDVGHGWVSWPDRDLWFEVAWTKLSREQSFTTPVGGISCDEVQLYLRELGIPGAITVGLYADSGGSPTGAALKEDVLTWWDVDTVAGWVSFTWVAEALAGATVFHIVLTVEAGVTQVAHLLWGGDGNAAYADGASQYALAGGAWVAATPDLYFRVYDSTGLAKVELDGTPVAFARFNEGWYCAAGDTVYKWNTTNHNWDSSEASAGNDITSMVVWAGFLWVSRGTATNVRKLNTSAVWADGGFEGGILYAGGHVAGGWLHIQDADNPHQFRYTSDGSALSDPFEVGSSDYSITGFVWFRDMLVVSTTVGLYGFAAEMVYGLFDWRSMEHADNGKAMFAWARDGALYIPLMYGLYRWNGDTFRAVGPEQGAPQELEWGAVPLPARGWPGGTWVPMPPRKRGGGGSSPGKGLPATRAGAIRGLWGTANWLYAVIEGGSTRTSSVMATDGMHGWHEVARAEVVGQVAVSLGYETVSSPSRLWYGLGSETRFLEMPDYSDNPYLWSGLSFQPSGELITPWVGSDLVEVVKDWHQVVIRGESFTTGQTVEVWYEVDRSGQWLLLGEVQTGPRKVLPFTPSVFASKIVGSSSTTATIELATGSTTADLAAGDWVRIGSEVAQVASVTDSDTFVLATALSEAPRPGDYVYSSRPAGRELRLKLILKTTDTTLTPKVEAVLIQFQPNVLDRWTWQLAIKCADNLKDLRGAATGASAAELRLELGEWATRVTPFTLVDIDGETWTVKVSAASERAVMAKERGEAGCIYNSVWDLVLLQVE